MVSCKDLLETIRKLRKTFFKLMQNSWWLPENCRKVADKTFSHQSYIAHLENILLAMLCDNNSFDIRKLAERGIIKARSNTNGVSKSLWRFTQSSLLFDALAYHFMINFQQTQLEEPPKPIQFWNRLFKKNYCWNKMNPNLWQILFATHKHWKDDQNCYWSILYCCWQ